MPFRKKDDLEPNPLLTQVTWYSSINKTKRKNFKSRLYVSIGVLIVMSVFLLFGSLSDVCNNWSLISNRTVKFLFAAIDVIAISLLIFFVNFEIKKNFYNNSSGAFLYFLLVNLIFFYAICLMYLLPLYDFIPGVSNKSPSLKTCSEFALTPICWMIGIFVVLMAISVFCFVKFFQPRCQKSYFFSLFYIHTVTMLGIFSMVYFLIVSGWTTFLFLSLLSMFSDTMSYLFGTKFGKNKIAHKISPNKTWEGMIYGLLSTLILMLVFVWLYSFINIRHHAITNIFLNLPQISSQVRGYLYYWIITAGAIIIFLIVCDSVGDLIMSYIKRIFQIKDFSRMLGAHGGILDRIDGLTCVFFAFMCIWSIFCSFSGGTVDILDPNHNLVPIK